MKVSRATRETKISLEVSLYGKGEFKGGTGLTFFDHMLRTLTFYSGMDLSVEAEWDLSHHLMEDLMYLLGVSLSKGLGDRKGIARYGWSVVPMDESLVLTSVDLGGRPYFSSDIPSGLVEGLSTEDLMHGVESFARGALATVHVVALRKGNLHHLVEASFKSLGLSLRQALQKVGSQIASVKGVIDVG